MTYDELLAVLVEHRALIVHCSRPGKAGESPVPLLFPDDLQNAMCIVANDGKELACSVVWPGHVETFGSVGIILRPRSVKSITSICNTDAGSGLDPETGKRIGLGVDFSAEAVSYTFANSSGHNEWFVTDAEPVGIFVNLNDGPLLVPKLVNPMDAPGYDPAMGEMEPEPSPVRITLDQVVKIFRNMRVFAFLGSEIIQVGVDPNVLYKN